MTSLLKTLLWRNGNLFLSEQKPSIFCYFTSQPHLHHPHSLCSSHTAPSWSQNVWGPSSVCFLCLEHCSTVSTKLSPSLILVRAQMSTSGRTYTTTSTFKLCSPTFLMLLILPYSFPYHSSPNRLKCAHVPSVSSHQHIHSLKKGMFLSFVQIYPPST